MLNTFTSEKDKSIANCSKEGKCYTTGMTPSGFLGVRNSVQIQGNGHVSIAAQKQPAEATNSVKLYLHLLSDHSCSHSVS